MMSTIACRRWDIVLVPFPFTDLTAAKRRPGLVVSPDGYNASVGDIVIAFVTSRTDLTPRPGDHVIRLWRESGLPKPSTVRMKFATLDAGIVLKRIGVLAEPERESVQEQLRAFFAGVWR
jgi:mRNA interferase MazF